MIVGYSPPKREISAPGNTRIRKYPPPVIPASGSIGSRGGSQVAPRGDPPIRFTAARHSNFGKVFVHVLGGGLWHYPGITPTQLGMLHVCRGQSFAC